MDRGSVRGKGREVEPKAIPHSIVHKSKGQHVGVPSHHDLFGQVVLGVDQPAPGRSTRAVSE